MSTQPIIPCVSDFLKVFRGHAAPDQVTQIEVIDRLGEARRWTPLKAIQLTDSTELDLPDNRELYFTPAVLKTGTTRASENAEHTLALWLDFDTAVNLEELDKLLAPSVVVQTNATGNVHCYWLLDSPVEGSPDIKWWNNRVKQLFSQAGIEADHCTDAARLMKLPAGKNLKKAMPDGSYFTPRVIRWAPEKRWKLEELDRLLPEADTGSLNLSEADWTAKAEELTPEARRELFDALRAPESLWRKLNTEHPEGQRSDELWVFIRSLFDHFGNADTETRETVFQLVYGSPVASKAHEPGKGPTWLAKRVEDAANKFLAKKESQLRIKEKEKVAKENSIWFENGKFTQAIEMDPQGMLERFLAEHGDKMAYIEGYDPPYFAVDPKTNRWHYDKAQKDRVYRPFVFTTHWGLEERERHLHGNGEAFDAFKKQVEKTSSINETMSLIQPRFTTRHGFELAMRHFSEFDSNPHIISVANGLIEVTANEVIFREATPEDAVINYLTVNYDSKATAPEFMALLERIQPDEDVRRYLQKVFGSALVGMAPNKFFILDGDNNAAKSTIPELIHEICKNAYSYIAVSSLLKSDAVDLERIGSWYRKRFILADDLSGKLNAIERLKQVSTGQSVNGRVLYEDDFSFVSEVTLVVTCNALVELPDDKGLHRRVVRIPFNQSASPGELAAHKRRLGSEPKKYILNNELPGVFNWLLEGAQMFLSEGFDSSAENLDAPESVRQATKGLWNRTPLAKFIHSNFDVTYNDNDKEHAANLYKEYCDYTDKEFGEDDEKPLSSHQFPKALEKIGLRSGRSNVLNRETGKVQNTQLYKGLRRK